ncbi:hypothetical protein SM033_00107 [Vibrio phage vB_VpaM_sm033]|nr:hypothetical protein SM033_00107 [Vibrio phage vB_VpaM_sm033]
MSVAKQQLFAILHTFPRSQKYDILPHINEALYSELKATLTDFFDSAPEEVLHKGRNYYVWQNVAILEPFPNADGGCFEFEVFVGGKSSAIRDSLRETINTCFFEVMGDFDVCK